MNKLWNPVRVYIEDAQGARNLQYAIDDIAKQQDTYVSIQWVVCSRMQGAKQSRINYIAACMLLDSLWISASCTHLIELKAEAEDFPTGKHDDLLDSLAQLCLALKPGTLATPPTAEEIAAARQKLIQEAFWNQMFGPDCEPIETEVVTFPAGRCGYGLV
jgi:hypothetical protein